jgi:hypothetical protein
MGARQRREAHDLRSKHRQTVSSAARRAISGSAPHHMRPRTRLTSGSHPATDRKNYEDRAGLRCGRPTCRSPMAPRHRAPSRSTPSVATNPRNGQKDPGGV